MYFPYFRGRQYELLALRDLTKGCLISKKVLPVIEPVKLTSTLDSALKAFANTSLSAGLVFNPAVGDLANDFSSIMPLYELLSLDYIIPSVLINDSASTCLGSEFIKSQGYDGVEYASTMTKDGYNFAIFDDELFECIDTHIYEIAELVYSPQEVLLLVEK